ncbi:MAG: hypothetical protein ACOC80_12625 [Petrotogales bacterium]
MLDVLVGFVCVFVIAWCFWGFATFAYGSPWFTEAIALDYFAIDIGRGLLAPYYAYMEREEMENMEVKLHEKVFWLVFPSITTVIGLLIV